MHLQGRKKKALCCASHVHVVVHCDGPVSVRIMWLACINRRGIIAQSDIFIGSPTGQAGMSELLEISWFYFFRFDVVSHCWCGSERISHTQCKYHLIFYQVRIQSFSDVAYNFSNHRYKSIKNVSN